MFIRVKNRQGLSYHYLVESEREGSKVKQRTIAYLGKSKSLEEAIKACFKDLETQSAQQRNFLKSALRHSDNKMWLAYARAAGAKATGLERRLEAYITLLAKAPEALQVKAKTA